MSKGNYSNMKGFTLIELMVALTVSLLVLLAAGYMFSNALSSSHANLRATTLEQNLNAITDIIATEIRRAGYWNSDSGTPYPANQYQHLRIIDLDNTNPGGECVLYFYDADEGGDIDLSSDADGDGDNSPNELRGFKWDGQDIWLRRSCNDSACMSNCAIGGTADDWERISDVELLNITSLSFDTIGSQCINLGSDDTTGNVLDHWEVRDPGGTTLPISFRCPCVAGNTDITFWENGSATSTNTCSSPPANEELVVGLRQVNIRLAGESADDNQISKTVETSVRIGNDLVCASQTCPP